MNGAGKATEGRELPRKAEGILKKGYSNGARMATEDGKGRAT